MVPLYYVYSSIQAFPFISAKNYIFHLADTNADFLTVNVLIIVYCGSVSLTTIPLI